MVRWNHLHPGYGIHGQNGPHQRDASPDHAPDLHPASPLLSVVVIDPFQEGTSSDRQ